MKFERRLLRISLLDTLLYLIILLVFINGIIFLISLIAGRPRIFISNGSWISQLLFPFFYSLIQNGINRNGILTITEYSDHDFLKNNIVKLIAKKGLYESEEKLGFQIYTKKTTFGKLLNFIFNEDIKVNYSENATIIKAKRNILIEMEQKLMKV